MTAFTVSARAWNRGKELKILRDELAEIEKKAADFAKGNKKQEIDVYAQLNEVRFSKKKRVFASDGAVSLKSTS